MPSRLLRGPVSYFENGWLQSILFSLVALGFQYSATYLWWTIRQAYPTKDCGNSVWLFLVLGTRKMAVYMAFSLYLICFDTVYVDPMSDVEIFRIGYKRGSGLGVVGVKWTVIERERGICSSSGLEPLRSLVIAALYFCFMILAFRLKVE